MEKNLTSVGLQSYYSGLSRKERVRLKAYVALVLGISEPVVANRFTGRREFSNAEVMALQPIIEGETWRQ